MRSPRRWSLRAKIGGVAVSVIVLFRSQNTKRSKNARKKLSPIERDRIGWKASRLYMRGLISSEDLELYINGQLPAEDLDKIEAESSQNGTAAEEVVRVGEPFSTSEWRTMQEDQISPPENEVPGISPRKERLIKQIVHHLQDPTEPSFDNLVEAIMALPDASLQQFIQVIAEYMFNTMLRHFFLNLVPTFSQHAAEEEIDQEEVSEVLSDKEVLAGMQQLSGLNKRLAAHSLDQLLRIEQITRGLQGLSDVKTAYDAKRWIYQLSSVYQNKLKHEHLITD